MSYLHRIAPMSVDLPADTLRIELEEVKLPEVILFRFPPTESSTWLLRLEVTGQVLEFALPSEQIVAFSILLFGKRVHSLYKIFQV